MTKKYTELHTFAEVDAAISSGEFVQCFVGNGDWCEAVELPFARRFRIVEEVEDKRMPVFGDEIIVWDFDDWKVKRKFIYFNSKGHGQPLRKSTVVLDIGGGGTVSYMYWCWPQDEK